MNTKQIVFIKKVTSMTGLHRQSIWRYVKAGKFPQPSKIKTRNAWLLSDIEAWIDSRMGVRS